MMEKKILFTDLDGTLLDDQKEIPIENRRAIRKALQEGHSVVISTGRPLESGKMVASRLGLMEGGCYMIAYNGAVVYDCGLERVLIKRSLSFPCVQELFARGRDASLHVHTYSGTHIVAMRDTPELQAYSKHTNLPYVITDDVMGALEEEPQKVMLIHSRDHGRLERFQAQNREWERGRCRSFFSTDSYLEYVPFDVSKAYGMNFLRGRLGVSWENTIAAGDERNDIPMLKEACIGVAMKNANAEVKACADYITERDNNEGGIAEIIEKFMLDIPK